MPEAGTGALDGLVRVKFEPPKLIGRQGDLARVHAALLNGHAAITGQGGIGKTQLAVLYAHEHARDYRGGVFLLDAAKTDRLEEDMAGYADRLCLPEVNTAGDERARKLARARQWIGKVEQRPDVLVILDDVADPGLLSRNLWGQSNLRLLGLGCRLLVTSRRRDLPGCCVLPLDGLAPEAARDLLARESGRGAEIAADPEAADRICRLLGHLPLVLRLGGWLLGKSPMDLAAFAGLLKARGAIEIVDHAKANLADYEYGLRVVLAEQWNDLPKDRPVLKRMLLALGILAEGRVVPTVALREFLGLPADPLGLFDPLEEAIEDLANRNLLEQPVEHAGSAVVLHPLIHAFAAQAAKRDAPDLPAQLAATAWARIIQNADFWRKLESSSVINLIQRLAIMTRLLNGGCYEVRRLRWLSRALRLQASAIQSGFMVQSEDAAGEIVHESRTFFDPLAQLYRQARLLGDDNFAGILATAREGRSGTWLKQLWSTARTDPALRCILRDHQQHVMAVAISADGSRAVSGCGSHPPKVLVWDLEAPDTPCLAQLIGHKETITGVAISADGSRVLSGSRDGTLGVYDFTLPEPCFSVGHSGHQDGVTAVSMTPDGKRCVSASVDRTVRVWDLTTGSPRYIDVLSGHEDAVGAVAISADGRRVISSSDDCTPRVWDVNPPNSGYLGVLTGHAHSVWAVALSADGQRAVSGSADGMMMVWDLTDPKNSLGIAEFPSDETGVRRVSLSFDGLVAISCSGNKAVRVWDLDVAEPRCVAILSGHESDVMAVSISADGRRAVSGSWDGNVLAWDLDPDEPRNTAPLSGHTGEVTSLALSADGGVAVSASMTERTAKVWDLSVSTPQCVATLTGHDAAGMIVALAANGRRAATGANEQRVRVWDLASSGPDCCAPFTANHDATLAIALSADGLRAIAGGTSGTLDVRDLQTAEKPLQIQLSTEQGYTVNSVALSADGSRMVTNSYGKETLFWDLTAGKPPHVVERIEQYKENVRCIALSADGQYAILAGRGSPVVWNWSRDRPRCIANLEEISSGVMNWSPITSLALSENGRRAVSGERKGTVIVWDLTLADPSCIAMLGLDSAATSCAMTADGRRILVGDAGGHLTLLEVEEGA